MSLTRQESSREERSRCGDAPLLHLAPTSLQDVAWKLALLRSGSPTEHAPALFDSAWPRVTPPESAGMWPSLGVVGVRGPRVFEARSPSPHGRAVSVVRPEPLLTNVGGIHIVLPHIALHVVGTVGDVCSKRAAPGGDQR